MTQNPGIIVGVEFSDTQNSGVIVGFGYSLTSKILVSLLVSDFSDTQNSGVIVGVGFPDTQNFGVIVGVGFSDTQNLSVEFRHRLRCQCHRQVYYELQALLMQFLFAERKS